MSSRGAAERKSSLISMSCSPRAKGQRAVIWGQQMAQMELAEALHCGLLGLDCLDSPSETVTEGEAQS